MPVGNPAHDERSWLANRSRRSFEEHVVEPQELGVDEIDAAIFGVRIAFLRVEGELYPSSFQRPCRVDSIPFRSNDGRRCRFRQ